MQHEVTVKQDLLNKKGYLNEPGWARHHIFNYHRKAVKAHPLRIKEWDYYLILNDKNAVALTVADNSYMGLISVSILDFENNFQHTNDVMTLFPCGKFHLPESPFSGITFFENHRVRVRFEYSEGKRKVECLYKNFKDRKDLFTEISMVQPFEDSIVIATPWPDDRKAFYYNQKIPCMPAKGFYEFGGKRVDFEDSNTFGILDWGRGVWTRDNTWYWGAGSGWMDGVRFGFNFGYGFGDTSAASENIIFYDGIANKLEKVKFVLSDPDDYMVPWKITSGDNRVNLDFVPVMDRAAKMNAVVISTNQHQVFGRVSGKLILDSGKPLTIKDLTCFFEIVHNIY